MRFSSAVLLFFIPSVFSKLSDSWEIDESCDGERLRTLESAHAEIVEILTKVTRDLSLVQQPKPTSAKTRLGTSWNRIARNLAGLFGIPPPDDPAKNGYDPEEQYFKQVLYTYDRMYQALVNGKAIPEKGYSDQLKNLNKKPLLMCGDTSGWEFYAKDAEDKYTKDKTVQDVFPRASGWDGAFIHANRYLPASKAWQTPGLCKPGIYGVTRTTNDLLTICDLALTLEDSQWPVRDAARVEEGTDLDRDNFGRESLVRVMIHEFAHYYGSKLEGGELKTLPDQQAVDANGCLLWSGDTTSYSREATEGGKKLDPAPVYSLRFCTNLNKDQTGNDNRGKFKKNGVYVDGDLGRMGPAAATWTAETYAYFAIISLCLVSRYFRGIAQEILHHSFDLKLPDYGDPNLWEYRLEPFLSTVALRPDLARSVKAAILEVPLIHALDFDQSRRAFDACAHALGSSARDIYHRGHDAHSSAIKRAFFRGTPAPKDMKPEDFIPTVASELLSILVSILPNLTYLGVEEDYSVLNRWRFDVSPATLDVLGISSIPIKTFESDRSLQHLLSRSTQLETLATLGNGLFPDMPTVKHLHLRSPAAIRPGDISRCLNACSGNLTTFSYTAVDTDIKSVHKCIDVPRLHASLESLHLDMEYNSDWRGREVPMPSLKNFIGVTTLLIHTFPVYGTNFSWCDKKLFAEVTLVDILPPNIATLNLIEEQQTPSARLTKDLYFLAREKPIRFPFLREINTNAKFIDEHIHTLFGKVGVELVNQNPPRCSWNCTAEVLLPFADVDEYNMRFAPPGPLPGDLSDEDL
ncbi:hypothetical protein FBEOM_5376 [Fusarium beomiforme]|uniref:Uncharacterized protein n=1 Tax=Fusarium beomiforme TaxID=44412 RepID=A0A9P5DZ16_9HYPO|nr:hypothetical protein FBEOM_5376 [Fusarium beomiforme]